MTSRRLRILGETKCTECPAEVHFGDCVEAFLSCDIPELKPDWLSVDVGVEFGGEVTADGGSYFFIEFVMNVLVEHGCFSDGGFAHHAELDD